MMGYVYPLSWACGSFVDNEMLEEMLEVSGRKHQFFPPNKDEQEVLYVPKDIVRSGCHVRYCYCDLAY